MFPRKEHGVGVALYPISEGWRVVEAGLGLSTIMVEAGLCQHHHWLCIVSLAHHLQVLITSH